MAEGTRTGFFIATAGRQLRGNEKEMEKQPFYEIIPLSNDPELLQWAITVKISAGYICKYCGESDHKLLDSHHIKTISQFPKRKYDVNNGICYCHAFQGHKDNKAIRDMILARLAIILYLRYAKPTDKEAGESLPFG